MESLKRQVLPGQLAVVATPIGNLEDLSPRARQVLTEADVILCEDTRHTAKLIAGSQISRALSSLERFDAHATEARVRKLVERLLAGESLAMVTDSGTPGISDPGARLVAAAREAGVGVVAVPGPSAVLALLSVAGVNETAFCFRGFFPKKEGEREAEIALARDCRASRLWVWFESPLRMGASLRKVSELCPQMQVIAGKELTKFHERVFAGKAGDVYRQVGEELENSGNRGEWCFAVLFPEVQSGAKSAESGDSSEWVKALRCLRDAGVSSSESVKHVCRHFSVPRNTVYELAVKIFQKKI